MVTQSLLGMVENIRKFTTQKKALNVNDMFLSG